MLMGGPAVTTHHQDWLLEYFHVNTMSVAPLAISSFFFELFFAFNTVVPV